MVNSLPSFNIIGQFGNGDFELRVFGLGRTDIGHLIIALNTELQGSPTCGPWAQYRQLASNEYEVIIKAPNSKCTFNSVRKCLDTAIAYLLNDSCGKKPAFEPQMHIHEHHNSRRILGR